MEETVFDKIIKKEIPADIVYEDDWVVSFRDSSPQAPIHLLVIPKKKLIGFSDLAETKSHEIGEFIKKIAIIAKSQGLEKNGYRVVFNQGVYGQQTVNYIHAHILGERQMKWPPG